MNNRQPTPRCLDGCLPLQRLSHLLFLLLLAQAVRPAHAQNYDQPLSDTTQIYSYVEQMPALPGGGGNLALVKALQQRVQLPAEVREGRVEGRVFVRVVVGVSGVARQAVVLQSLNPACDAAALTAVAHLPRLLPGRYNGLPVAVLLTVPVVFFSPRHVFGPGEVARAAQFPGGDAALEAFLKKNQQTPAEVQQRDLRGRTAVRFVLRADGRVGASEVVTSLSPACDDEALRLVRLLPRWQPAQGYDDRPVAVAQTLNIWFHPPAPAAGVAPPVPDEQVYARAEQLPALPSGGGLEAVQRLLLETIAYPARAVGGDCVVSFVVEPDGRVTRPVVTQSLGAALDQALIAAALRLPRFVPGRQRGQPVAVRLTVPLTIVLH